MQRFFSILMGALLALIFVIGAHAAPRGGVDTSKVRELTKEEAQKQWTEFSKSGIAKDYTISFEVTHLPRKAKETRATGIIYGTKTPEGFDVSRIKITDENNNTAEYILKNSAFVPQVWRKSSDGKFVSIPQEKWSEPFLKGFILSPFDLLMPYKFWTPKYSGVGRIGQAVHFYTLKPASDFGDVKSVRIALSREFNAPVEATTYADAYTPLKTLSLSSVKKADGLWIMRELSLRDDATRDRDKLRFIKYNFSDKNPKKIFDATEPQEPALREMKKL